MTHSPEIKAKIHELKASGATLRDIATQLGIGKSTVSSILRSGQTSSEEIPEPVSETDNMPRQTISELPDQDSYAKSLEPAAAPTEAPNKAAILEFAKSLRRRKEKAEAPEEASEEAPEEAPIVPEPVVVKKPVQLDRGTIIAKISSLITAFGPILSSHVKDPVKFIDALPGKSLADLKSTLEMLETTKSITLGARGLFNMFNMVAQGVEKAGSQFLHLRTEGFSTALLTQEEELRLIFQELAYENVDSIKRVQSPTARLAFLMITTLLATDSRNRTSGVEAPPDMASVESKFSDL